MAKHGLKGSEGGKYQIPAYIGDKGDAGRPVPGSSDMGKVQSPAYGPISKGEKSRHSNGK